MTSVKGMLIGAGSAMLLATSVAWAQDEAPAAPAAPVKARPAEIAPLASRTMLLDIVNTGKHLIAVGDRGTILASNDGSNWAQVAVPVRATLTAVTFADEKNGWAVGHDAVILHTADGGKTWALQNFDPALEKPLLDVVCIDAQHAYAVGAYGSFLETADGGNTWAAVDAPAILTDELHLNTITRLGNGELFVAGETGLMGVSKDGKKWDKLVSPYESSMFGALPLGAKGAVIFGLRGNVFISADVRSNKWKAVDAGTVASLFGGTVLPDGEIAIVGLSGEIVVLDASGEQARTVKSGLSTTQSGVLAWKDGLLLVGESGIKPISLKQ